MQLNRISLSSPVLALCFVLALFSKGSAQACELNLCSPGSVLFAPSLENSEPSAKRGCIAFIQAFDEELMGGNVADVSLSESLSSAFTDITGSWFGGLGVDILLGNVGTAEKFAAATSAAIEGRQSYEEAAWILFVEAATKSIRGTKVMNGALKFADGRVFSRSTIVFDKTFGPIFENLANSIRDRASDWLNYVNTSKAWSYSFLPHCVYLDKWSCFANFQSFLKEYPSTGDFLQSAQTYSCQSVTVNSLQLNLREAPSKESQVLTVLKRFDQLAVVGRNKECSWVQVVTPNNQTTGWVSASLVRLNVPCNSIALVSTTFGPYLEQSNQPTAPVTGLITDFERWGNWVRGDEPFGTFKQSQKRVHSGYFAGEFSYKVPANRKNFVVYRQTIPIDGQPSALQMWVYGDGSGSYLNVWIEDAKGQRWQFGFGAIYHTGWQQMTARLQLNGQWPNGPVGEKQVATSINYPIKLFALIIDGIDDLETSGVVYFDDLTAVGGSIPSNGANATQPSASTPTSTPLASSPTSISFYATNTHIMAGGCTSLNWAVDGVWAVYLDGQPVSGYATRHVCPDATQSFRLNIIHLDNRNEERAITIQVTASLPTPQTSSSPIQTSITFAADRNIIHAGECATLRWDVEEVREIYLDGQAVTGHESRQVCPVVNQSYRLNILRQDNNREDRIVEIQVQTQQTTQPVAPQPPQSPIDTCGAIPTENYSGLGVVGPPTDRPADSHADMNLALRGYQPTTAQATLMDFGPPKDSKAPQLVGLFADQRTPTFITAYQVFDWDWGCNCRGGLLSNQEATMLGMGVTPGETILTPDSGYSIGDGYEVLVLYADGERVTLKYTREDNVVSGFTVHIEGLCVEPRLLGLYQSFNQSGRGQLPALRPGQALGRAKGSEIRVAVRDGGVFFDPRSRQNWWQGR